MTTFKTEIISLGGREFVASQLPFKLLKKFVPKLAAVQAVGPVVPEQSFDALAEAVLLGLQPRQPELTLDELMSLPINPDEMAGAVASIARLCGLQPASGAV